MSSVLLTYSWLQFTDNTVVYNIVYNMPQISNVEYFSKRSSPTLQFGMSFIWRFCVCGCYYVFQNFICKTCCINLLKPAGHMIQNQFNIQQLYALPTLYLCVLYLSENKQRLVPLTA